MGQSPFRADLKMVRRFGVGPKVKAFLETEVKKGDPISFFQPPGILF